MLLIFHFKTNDELKSSKSPFRNKRSIFSWISDQPQVDATLVSAVAIMAGGIATAVVPFFTQYWHFIAYCVPFATGVGMMMSFPDLLTEETNCSMLRRPPIGCLRRIIWPGKIVECLRNSAHFYGDWRTRWVAICW